MTVLVAFVAALSTLSIPTTAFLASAPPGARLHELSSSIDYSPGTWSKASTVEHGVQVKTTATTTKPLSIIMDEEALVKAQKFAISPDELISKAKAFLGEIDFSKQGDYMSDDNFVFLGPVVGPLTKEAYLKAIASFDVLSIFPDINPRYFGWTVDPFDCGRVWAISRGVGSNPASGKSFEAPPQAVSVTFNAKGMVTKFTIGHVMDRSVGNTGGLGGLFGPLYAIGKGLPFPEGQPWKPSWRYRFFNFIGKVASKFKKE